MKWILLISCALVMACGADSSNDDNSPSATQNFDFAGGDFQLYVNKVYDECLDGSLDLLFMPEGTQSPYALKNKTSFPPISQLPTTVNIKLEAPFSSVMVNLTADGGYSMAVKDAVLPNIDLQLPSGECTADLTFNATFSILSQTEMTAVTTVSIKDFTSTSDLCPEVQSDPCQVVLNMTAQRQ